LGILAAGKTANMAAVLASWWSCCAAAHTRAG
jgi:hypothetical protein